ncbi:olfactory receptor 2AP1-like [Sceloporus undulatus]|uniref:olfactory receptor 2AP1-like n=1 Tax=Sceloporus undulatus TaxID=8520 RepID=UPI001C4D72E5|nr:olfactory receptor 2AP1-like [Sceloporus undulatus]
MKNQTVITEFILLGFEDLQLLQIPLFLLFFFIYLLTMAGNLLIIVLIIIDRHLHIPMYFFLGNLSCLEVCSSTTILPRLLASFLSNNKVILIRECMIQYFFFGSFAGIECYLLSVMSYDRYVAICKPLHYATLMNNRFCRNMAFGSWLNGLLASAIVVSLMSQLIFCGPNEINHFFCDSSPVLKLSCSDTHPVSMAIFLLSSIFTFPPFILTLTSYVCIILKILRISSVAGRKKTFSTCSSHLLVVTIFYGTLMTVYVLPETNSLINLKKVFSVFYTILTPLINPFIYSLRNQEVKLAMRRIFYKLWTKG